MTVEPDYYEILGTNKKATQEEIKILFKWELQKIGISLLRSELTKRKEIGNELLIADSQKKLSEARAKARKLRTAFVTLTDLKLKREYDKSMGYYKPRKRRSTTGKLPVRPTIQASSGLEVPSWFWIALFILVVFIFCLIASQQPQQIAQSSVFALFFYGGINGNAKLLSNNWYNQRRDT